MASIGKTAEEIHADLIAEEHDVTLAEVEEEINAMVELGFSKGQTFRLVRQSRS